MRSQESMSTRPEDHRGGRYNAVTGKLYAADYGSAMARGPGGLMVGAY